MSNGIRKARNFAALSGGALVVAPFVAVGTAEAGTYTVSNTNDSGEGSLRKAIEDANANPDADVITFDAAVSGTITLSSRLEIRHSVDIQGPGATVITVDGDDSVMVFYVADKTDKAEVSISGLTITGGKSEVRGGAISQFGEDLTLEDSVITGNTGKFGAVLFYGSAYGDEGTLTISNCTISGNTGTMWAGGVYVETAGAVGELGVVIESSTISGNDAASYGGGLYLGSDLDGDVLIVNSTIDENAAIYGGGGIWANSSFTGSLTISSSTIVANMAEHGGGLYIVNSGNTSVTIVNSIVAGNTATAVAPADASAGNDIYSPSGEPIEIDYSLIGSTVGYSSTGAHNLSGDPMLGALADNGGDTKTRLPLAGSPVIDAGDPAYTAPPSIDQRGLARVAGGRVDIGAVEVQPAALPPTGGSNGLMAGLGAALLGLGGALHLTGRRKRTA